MDYSAIELGVKGFGHARFFPLAWPCLELRVWGTSKKEPGRSGWPLLDEEFDGEGRCSDSPGHNPLSAFLGRRVV